MHFDFKGIMEGAWNSVFVKEKIEKISEERLVVCATCPHQSNNKKKEDPKFKSSRPDVYCTLCGCNLQMKTRALSQTCPDKPIRWDKVIEEKEEWELDSRLEQEQKNNKKLPENA